MGDQVDSGLDAQTTEGTQPQGNLQQKGDSETQQGNLPAGAKLADVVRNDPEAMKALRPDFQADKDRGVVRAQKQSSEAITMVKNLAKRLGMSDDDIRKAQRDMVLDDLVDERINSLSDVGGQTEAEAEQAASSTTGEPVNVESIQQAYPMLDFNDTEVIQVYKQNQNKPADLALALQNLVIQKASKKTDKPSTAISPGEGNPPAKTSTDISEIDDPEVLTQIWLSGGKK